MTNRIAPRSTCAPGCARLCTAAGMAEVTQIYRSRMYAKALRIVIDRHLAEEAVQEAMLNAWRRCASFDASRGNLQNWLLTITANAAVDLVKARNRRPPVASTEPADEPAGPSDSIADVDLLLLRSELKDALSAIGPEHRKTIIATMIDDRPYAEVARDLGIAPATVRTRVHYALRKMRAVMEAA